MKKYINKFIALICRLAQVLLSPITSDGALFINIILLMIIPTLFNVFVFNSQEYIIISRIYKWGIRIGGGGNFPYILFMPYAVSYILCVVTIVARKLTCAKVSTYLKICIYVAFSSICAINIFLLFNYQTMVSPSIITLVKETNGEETSDFLRQYIFCTRSILSYFTMVVIIGYLVYSNRKTKAISMALRKKYAMIFLFVFSTYMFQRVVSPIENFFKILNCQSAEDIEYWCNTYHADCNTVTNLIYSFYTIGIYKQMNQIAISNILNENENLSALSDVDIILIIGESFNKHHSSLYGYKHTTNPLLGKEKDNGNLFLFYDVVASYNFTSLVIKNLFSVNSIMGNERWYDYPTFPMIFRRAGYDVYFWDNQLTTAKAEISDFSIASYIHNPQIEDVAYSKCNNTTYKFDNELICSFYADIRTKSKRNLIIFHLKGQHIQAASRFPQTKQFLVFNKDSIKSKYGDMAKRRICEYDNCTTYNDYVVYNILNHNRNKNSVVIYFSDHGDEIYDFREQQGRTLGKKITSDILKHQYQIPFMIWCSDSFIKKYPNVIENIKAAQHKPYMNDNVCQILFGLAGINTKYYHPERDLISPKFKPCKYRLLQGKYNYEKIMGIKYKNTIKKNRHSRNEKFAGNHN